MSLRSASLVAFLVPVLSPAVALAQKDKDLKKWPDEVAAIMLPQEEKTYRGLKDKADREEFQKIFWARRDPDLDTPENEFMATYEKQKAEADQRYKVPGTAGSRTDCGRVFILLGEPNEVQKDGEGSPRAPETWTFRDRPGQTFTGGQAQISFDENCALPPGARTAEQLNRVAETKIAHPNIDYRPSGGHLTKLVDLLPKPTPAQALLKEPRQDFTVSAQASYLKVQDGGTALLGLVRGDATGLPVEDQAGKKVARVTVVAQAVADDGKPAAFAENETQAEVGPDNTFVGSFRMGLKPGKYTLKAGALDAKSNKGAVASVPVEVPDLNKGELTIAGPVILRDVEEVSDPASSARHAYSAFELGGNRLIPRFGSVLAKTDTPSFFYQYYDAALDPTGKASVVASLSVLKEGKPVAKAPDQTFENPIGGTVVGPVPLANYEPGTYVVQIKIQDNIAKKPYTQEVPFELK
jgi:GWxTD domain-containing protein